MARLAYIGLGVMGFPMAGHSAAKGGHEIAVYNRTPARAQAWVAKFGGKSAGTPAEAADGAEFVVTKIIDGYYAEIQEMGASRWDTSSLIRRLRK